MKHEPIGRRQCLKLHAMYAVLAVVEEVLVLLRPHRLVARPINEAPAVFEGRSFCGHFCSKLADNFDRDASRVQTEKTGNEAIVEVVQDDADDA